MIDKPGIYLLPEEEYHSDPCVVPSFSSHGAVTIIQKSPLHAWYEHPRLNPAFEAKESDKFDLGSAAHALILEGEDRMQVIPFDDYRKNEAKAMRDTARASGKHPILEKNVPRVYAMRDAFLRAWRDCPDLAGVTLARGKVEQSIFWQRPDGTWCRARPDFLDDAVCIDVKTTEASANPDSWVRTMLNMGGHIQAAHYLDGIETVTGKPRKWVFGVQEVEPPYAATFIGLPPAFIEYARNDYERAAALWRKCLDRDLWPGYPTRICWADPPEWAIRQQEERLLGNPYDYAALFPAKETDPAV